MNHDRDLLAVKAYRLAEMDDCDWERVVEGYATTIKEWWTIPTVLWLIIIILGFFLIIFGSLPLRIIGIIIGFYSSLQLSAAVLVALADINMVTN